MKRQITFWLRWVIFNGLFSVALWLAVFGPLKENAGFVRALQAYGWCWALLQFPIALLLLIAAATAKPENLTKYERPVKSRMVEVLFDLAVCGVMAYAGWVWLSVFWFLHMLVQGFIHHCVIAICDKRDAALKK